MKSEYKKIEKNGITAIILNKSKILILKRINLPFVSHPGTWWFVSGGRERNENPLQTAYREIREETGIEKGSLKLLSKNNKIIIKAVGKMVKWEDPLFIFCSKNRKVKLNVEHRALKWVSLEELAAKDGALKYILNKKETLKLIKSKIGSSC